MKRTILLLSMVLALGLTTANAQNKTTYGVKVGANFSNFVLTDLPTQKSSMKAGADLGGFMNINVHPNISIQPEVKFFYRSSKAEMGPAEDTFKQWGMQIPVYALGQTELGNGKFYGGVGPFLGVGFDARYDASDLNLYEKKEDKAILNRWDLGIGALIGYEFSNGCQINVEYQYGFIDQMDALKDLGTKNTQNVSVVIGYRF